MKNDQEYNELKKKKELLRYQELLDSLLYFFAELEQSQAQVIPMLDGFDLEHNDTYLELTKDIRNTLLSIIIVCQNASYKLSNYRKLCNQEQKSDLKIQRDDIKQLLKKT
ncbi:hypothetical protein [Pleurocapsa sp. PCC 7319]|uniref:hypothetical protein n=1 Tax=Pleurocapsa sp. PCC 7319 TaxID=118161 RepID=UPI00034C6DF4|nr:hypothetical protein [Pleurocapsa sp. PCC 7319]